MLIRLNPQHSISVLEHLVMITLSGLSAAVSILHVIRHIFLTGWQQDTRFSGVSIVEVLGPRYIVIVEQSVKGVVFWPMLEFCLIIVILRAGSK